MHRSLYVIYRSDERLVFLCRWFRARTSPVFEEPASKHERLHDLRGQHDSPRLLGNGGMADPQQTHLRNSTRGECWSSLPSPYPPRFVFLTRVFFITPPCVPIGQLVNPSIFHLLRKRNAIPIFHASARVIWKIRRFDLKLLAFFFQYRFVTVFQ